MKYRFNLLVLAVISAASAGTVHAETAGAPLQMGQHIQIGAPRGGDPAVYDSTGGTFTVSTSQPNSYIGGAANFSGPGPQVDITGVDVFMASIAATSYTNIRIRVQFWDIYTAAGSPVYSNAAGTVIEADTGPITTAASTVNTLTVTLPAPLRLNSLTAKGFAVNFQGDTGSGLADTSNLVTAIAVNGAPTVGTSAVGSGNGFYRNASARTDFNFVPTDLRSFAAPTTNARAALIVRGNASVPVMLQSFDVN
jgi:hypothetical protein